jgi:aminoglycoside phosphotransferase
MSKKVEIPANCEFPQLQEMADNHCLAAALRQHLGTRLAEQGYHIASCRIRRIYYKTGKCRLTIKAKNCDKAGREVGEQVYFGRVFPPGKGKAAFEQARRQELLQPEFGDPIGFIPEWETVVWAYPNDPNLIGITALMNPESTFHLVAAHPERFGIQNGYRPKAVAARLAKYVPGKRCAYFFDFSLEEKSNGAAKAHTIFGKIYTTEEGAEAYAIMNQVWQTQACQNGAFRMPQPYWYDEERNSLWQEALPGQALAKIAAEIDLAEIVKAAGAGLAALHGSNLNFTERLTIAFQLQELQASREAINATFPQYAEACSAVHNKLMAAYPKLPPVALTPVHGSFKFSHVFYTGQKVAFIDFDGARQGDPCYDLGRFIAHICQSQVESTINAETARRAIANFCAAYHSAATTKVPQERIDWFASAHLLTSEVRKAVKCLNPGLVVQLLEIAEKTCPEI